MINQELKGAINQKVQNGEFDVADFQDYFTIFCQLGNEIEDLQDEVDGWNRRVQINLEGAGHYWISVENGQFTTGKGGVESPDLTLTLVADAATQVFTGEKDAEAAFLAGALKVQGDLPDAIKFRELLEIVIEEIEY
jgi:putative sterol carrier protein